MIYIIPLLQMLQSYHHITERSKYIQEYERQKMFLEFFSEYTFEFKIVSLSIIPG